MNHAEAMKIVLEKEGLEREKVKKVLEYLKKLAEKQTHINDEEFDGTFGGNYDDAYRAGTEDGEIWIARMILTNLNIPFKNTL